MPAEETELARYAGARKMIASVAIVASVLSLTACASNGNGEKGQPTVTTLTTTPTRPTISAIETTRIPLPTRTIDPDARVFLDGIAALPDDLEMQTIITRICYLLKQDFPALGRYDGLQHSDEMAGLNQGYNQLYADTHNEPTPGRGGSDWAGREVRSQCPDVSIFKPSG